MIGFIIRNQLTEDIYFYRTKDEASDAALEKNEEDDRRPRFELYEILGIGRCRYHGYLWREFGSPFNRENCWKQ